MLCVGRGAFVPRLEHLTCFVAGNLALGVHTGAVNGTRADKYMALARNLTNTCYEMYRRMPTGAANPPLMLPSNPCKTLGTSHVVLALMKGIWRPSETLSLPCG